MPEVAFVCMSDLHFGAHNGLLTPTGEAPGEGVAGPDPAIALSASVGRALAATLAALNPSKPPGLVLLGDIFDLSLGTPEAASAGLRRFLADIGGTSPRTRFGTVFFLPGNHDHEMWTAQRYQRLPASTEKFRHTTPAFAGPEAVPGSPALDAILAEAGFGTSSTYYPNMAVATPDGRMVVFHHGHFVESMYSAMTSLLAATGVERNGAPTLEELERDNGSWIDFVWSTIGDDGLLGSEASLAYDYLMTGGESVRFQRRLSTALAQSLYHTLPLPRIAQTREALALLSGAAVDGLVGLFGQSERFSYTSYLSADSLSGLARYLGGPTKAQIEEEGRAEGLADVTFVFGHTHKPFEDRLPLDGFGLPPAIYNTGGWSLDTPLFGTLAGAAVVFVDDALNTASLRLFNTPREDSPDPAGTPPPVRVATADGTSAGNPMALALGTALAKASAEWDEVARDAEAAYRALQNRILSRLRIADRKATRTGELL